jgi:hypothetical protein
MVPAAAYLQWCRQGKARWLLARQVYLQEEISTQTVGKAPRRLNLRIRNEIIGIQKAQFLRKTLIIGLDKKIRGFQWENLAKISTLRSAMPFCSCCCDTR